MKTACVTWLVVSGLLVFGFTAWFFLRFPAWPTVPPTLPDTGFRLKYAVGAGTLCAIAVICALSMSHAGWARLRERAALVRAAEGGLPADGERGVFFGPIHRDGPALTAPLSGRDCLLYRYEVTHIQTRNRPGASRTRDVSLTDTVVDAEGFALTPSSIQTAGGPVKLLTLVKVEFAPDRFTPDQVAANYKAYAAVVELRGSGGLDAHDSLRRALLKPGDGAVRYDLGTGELPQDAALLIEEHVVRHGDPVVAFGTYSAAKGGIVSDPDSVYPIDVRLRRGSLEALTRGLTLGALGYALGALAFSAVSAAGAWAFFRLGPSHIWD